MDNNNNGIIKAIRKLVAAYKRTQDEHLLEIIYILLDEVEDSEPVFAGDNVTFPIVGGGDTITIPYVERQQPKREAAKPYDMSVSTYSAPFVLTTTTATTGMTVDATTGDITYTDSTWTHEFEETD